MSADLFAEFDSVDTPPAQQNTLQNQAFFTQPSALGHNTHLSSQTWGNQVQVQNPGTTAWPTLDRSQSQGRYINTTADQGDDDDDDDDGWGDFEVAAPAPQPASAAKPTASKPPAVPALNQPSLAGQQVWQGVESRNPTIQRTRIVRASTIDLMTNNLLGTSAATPAAVHHEKPASHLDDFLDWGQPLQSNAPPKPSVRPSRDASDSVLFDADDYGEGADLGDSDGNDGDVFDDDFGDFETGTTPLDKSAQDLLSLDSAVVPTAKAPGIMSLSSLNINSAPLSRYAAPKSPSYHERNPFPGLVVTTPPADGIKQLGPSSKATPSTAWPSAGVGERSPTLDDGWGAFEDFPPGPSDSSLSKGSRPVAKPSAVKVTKADKVQKVQKADSDWDWGLDETDKKKPAASAKKTSPAPPTKLDPSWDWDAANEPQPAITATSQSKDDVPPVNIPPPSVLMSIFPQLLGQANTFLFKPTAGQPQSIKDRVLSDPKTLDFLRGHLTLARVAARIIAGRKSRWHRDKFLAQSMSISAAGSKGMKLAGVDKAQTARESREAGDVIDLWKENAGRLRSAIAAVNAAMAADAAAAQLRLPELSESMHVSTAKDVPSAAKACIICGLKREERVAKVDYTVEDSFGEWWVDHWGHIECKRFWLEHETALRQR
ncbi:hypothetical protein MN608_02075 [Microdochium nivale]|nr:hypothetical protein MN608_02075 [Microdochium nivale]